MTAPGHALPHRVSSSRQTECSHETGNSVNGTDTRHIHMIGICGTAMGAVAVLLKECGHHVTGSDEKAYPPMSTVLRDRSISVMQGYRPENLDPPPDLVVIGNAMSRGNEEVEATLERKLHYVSLAETLKEFFIRGKESLVVTGTHGKTTASALLAWVLENAGRSPGFMIGGIPENFGVGARLGGGPFFVTEGDEYDTAFFDKRSKFLHYLPDCVIINNIEFDHADIFDSVEAIELSFSRMLNIVPQSGLVVANAGDVRVMRLTEKTWPPRVTFGLGAGADWTARNLVEGGFGSQFDLVGPVGRIRCQLPLAGVHNVTNALGVAAMASHIGLSLSEIAGGFAGFKGVRRRLQRLPSPDDIVLYDDFAHHPTAIAETLRALRARHPGGRLWALFEPRSNTTVRNIFQKELASALSGASVALIAKIHRQDKIPEKHRLDPEQLVADLRSSGLDAQYLPDPKAVQEYVVAHVRSGDVITLMSNGAFGGLAQTLPAALSRTSNALGGGG